MLGAGNRGLTIYGTYAQKNQDTLKFIAVAEPLETRRKKFAKLHNIPPERCYVSWEDLLKEGKIADIAFVCTQDQQHIEPTLKALDLGYEILLEKPMAHNLKGCVDIVKKVEDTGRILGVAHVLRYTDFFSKIKNIIQEGLLGDVIHISHNENISWYHIAHSFVRGNWCNVEKTSPMILQKCCHDLDLLFWMVDSLPKNVNSLGNLKHFRSENAPNNAPQYCLEGCPVEKSCLYYAPRIYKDIIPITQIMRKSENKFLNFLGSLRDKHTKTLTGLSKIIPVFKGLRYWKEWPVEPLYYGYEENECSDECTLNILKTSPYGRCVYYCDNNVVDHQIVNIEFENGATATLTMHGFSEREGRTLRIDGTKGTLIGEFYDSGEKISLFDHYSGTEEIIFYKKLTMAIESHQGGDFKLIDEFLDSIVDKTKVQPLTNARTSLESHLMAFAAEEARKNHIVVKMTEFRKKAYDL
jgi:predicted dehydrogenase